MMESGINRARKRAFTLLEVLMVIVIIGVLAVVVLTQISGTGERANRDLAQSLITGKLTTAIETFKLHCKRYPTSEEGLMALIEPPSDEEASKQWGGAYLDRAQLKDPWGREFRYVFPGEFNAKGFDLSSAGPDGVHGNEDDVTNWQKT